MFELETKSGNVQICLIDGDVLSKVPEQIEKNEFIEVMTEVIEKVKAL